MRNTAAGLNGMDGGVFSRSKIYIVGSPSKVRKAAEIDDADIGINVFSWGCCIALFKFI
jgi:hypothetical protein